MTPDNDAVMEAAAQVAKLSQEAEDYFEMADGLHTADSFGDYSVSLSRREDAYRDAQAFVDVWEDAYDAVMDVAEEQYGGEDVETVAASVTAPDPFDFLFHGDDTVDPEPDEVFRAYMATEKAILATDSLLQPFNISVQEMFDGNVAADEPEGDNYEV
ncbi:MAG: hypothetical protein SVU32_00485 [Candidatus Nanohaloarchaea archaeon]|nr:hypothetical protein [Candidatus Nanohaloarchaea archaeon]